MQDRHHTKPVRKHAAIMFTDISGYTALMGSDENLALEVLKKNREIHQREVKKYKGKIIKEIGDGMLVSFDLASDAVYCAIGIQLEAGNKNIPLKIGIHEGEILFEGQDVLGDGVNVASRLQEITEVGGLTISNSVYRDVKNKPGIQAESMGEIQLKNVDDPLRVYKVHCKEIPDELKMSKTESRNSDKKKVHLFYIIIIFFILAALVVWYFATNEKNESSDKTVAVLPFHDDSPEKDNEYFCNGMMEEILNHLQNIKDLHVKSRTSVEQYRNPTRDIIAIGKELDVAFLLEGSVRKYGDDLRITAQLIDANTGNHLWSEVYDGKYTEAIFDFQSGVAKRIAQSMNAVITPEEEQKIDLKPTRNMVAYDLLRQASYENHNYWKDGNKLHLINANKLLGEVLDIDSLYIWAMTLKGDVYNALGNYDSAYYYAKMAIQLEPDFGWAYGTMGTYYRFTGQFDLAIENYKIAITDYDDRGLSGDGKWYEFLIGFIYCTAKDNYEEGLPFLQSGFDIKATNGASQCMMIGIVFSNKGDFNRADKYYRRMIELEVTCRGIENYSMALFQQGKFAELSGFLDTVCVKQSCWLSCNRMRFFMSTSEKKFNEAEDYYKQYMNVGGRLFTPDSLMIGFIYKNTGRNDIAMEILKNVENSYKKQLARNNYWRVNMYLSLTYALLDNKELCLKHLSDMIDQDAPPGFYYLIQKSPIYDGMQNDPEYLMLIERAITKIEATRTELELIMENEDITL